MDKDKEFNLSPDIEKLTEKLAKDPSSKLFVPLAEEYRKSGMFDEAIQVLMDGLKANPNYMTARVSLGKMLLEKGNVSEAQAEFEKVVQAIPDNLFAHKKLSEIYQSEGNRENLLKEYKIILSLSPKDEEIIKAIEELESTPVLAPAEATGQKPELPEHGIKPKTPQEGEEETMMVEEETQDVCAITPEELPAKELEVDKVQEWPGEELEEISGFKAGSPEEKKDVVYELPEEAISPEELGIDIPSKMTPVAEKPITEEMEKMEASIKESQKEELATETMAEIYIKQGLYEKADEIYQQILSSEPENTIIRQKRAELAALMNFMKGKEPGVTDKISKLEAWLKNIEERRR